MSLIPYHPREGREIVLRHHNAIVVRDPSSQRLEIRGLSLTECPTCHQPLRSPSPDRHFDNADGHDTYVDPEYFRMLRAGNDHLRSEQRPPSSPIRRLVHPPVFVNDEEEERLADAEFISSTPAVPEGSRIRKEAFSPNYFKTFFKEERELGRGGKGVVLLVRHEIDGCYLGYFACKRVPVGNDHAWLEKVLVEVELLAKLSHPNLVSYRHVWLEDVNLNRFGPSVACAFILQQYCNGGDLHHYVIGDQPKETTKEELKAQMRRRSKGQSDRPNNLFLTQRRLPFDEIYSLFRDITSGLAYLHAANYIHRDLKPSNCLLHREGNHLVCLISDFGEVQPENAVRKSTGSTGTISYCAPEVLKKDAAGRYGNFTTKSDIFSLGMILYFTCFGRLPYRSANAVQEELEDIDLLRAEITDWKGFQDERRERPDLPSELYHLLKKMLALSPAERPSANEVLAAMKSGSGLDGVPRAARSASPTAPLRGRRIQNLDSPMQPGTPVPDPTKHAHVANSSEEDMSNPVGDDFSPQASPQNNLQKNLNAASAPSNTRRHSHAMVLSRSQDRFARAGSSSPQRSLSPTMPGADRDRDRRGSTHSNPQASPATITTPLLMGPPTTFLGDMRHRFAVAAHHTAGFTHEHADSLALAMRLLLFLGKMWSLTALCYPYTASLGIGASLVAIAGLDLGIPATVAAESAAWERQQLQHGGRNADAVVLRDGGARRRGGSITSRWEAWDWRASSALVVLHMCALWVAYRFGTLCAGWH